MAFTYTTALQERIAYAVWGVSNSLLTAAQKALLDATWTSGSLSGGVAYDAYIEVSQLAQYFEQASSNPDLSFAQPAWNRLFIAKAAMILAKSQRPDRFQEFVKDHETAYDEAIDTYTRDLVSTTSLAGQGVGLSAIRANVIDHCVKRADASTGLRRRLFPQIAQIDGHIQWTMNYVWNYKPWHFRKRQVTMNIETESVTGATWTESSKTLTQTGAFTNTRIAAGARVLLSGGTGIITGEYVIASRTSDDAIVLDTSISSAATDLTSADIVGKVQVVTLYGMQSGETFDAVESRKFYYDNTFNGSELMHLDSSDMAKAKAREGFTSNIPRWFRWEKYGASGLTWHVSPFPNSDYTLRGAVRISGPGTLSTSASLDTAMARFPAEFGPVIRDIVLARTLLAYRASDGESMFRRAMEQCDNLLPVYADQGWPSRQEGMEDVYDDFGALRRWAY